MRPIDLDGFEAKFKDSPDPWATWTDRDEVIKRQAIEHAMGSGRIGRLLELGAGNGSNSRALCKRALRLDATEATGEGTRLVGEAVAGCARARATQLIVPAAPPRPTYDAIVIAEMLYYLSPRTMRQLARQIDRLLPIGGTLILAHHRITFYDFSQKADHIQRRFLGETRCSWKTKVYRRTGRWRVLQCKRILDPDQGKR
ncbi:SAM-dependent methyltransferase [Sphingomonas beigongshangi]|uniref:SAM-dependent methyltransferase n=1 Tax=Sphingomonas beigongshangi TaxID=2782540 RepID=UPI001AED7982|nr:class I SAM-dependent methyltransferase [Sphingomonas beigongshangi]